MLVESAELGYYNGNSGFSPVDLLWWCYIYPSSCARLTIFLRQIAASFVTMKARKERHDNVYH